MAVTLPDRIAGPAVLVPMVTQTPVDGQTRAMKVARPVGGRLSLVAVAAPGASLRIATPAEVVAVSTHLDAEAHAMLVSEL